MTLVEKYMKEHNLSDPWDVVDLFEKKMAEYAGSKYGVAVDNCTNALFLCLKVKHWIVFFGHLQVEFLFGLYMKH